MLSELIEYLRCPQSGERLQLRDPQYQDGRIKQGWLVAESARYRYPIHSFIPRFVPKSNYADNFGMQWNKFRLTQLDSHSGHPISANRFWAATGWKPEDLAEQWVLDVGCGAGRFAEVALAAGAKVVALDYSSAVDACYTNNSRFTNLHVVQGDIYALPFVRGLFSFVYSLGVLQHTPDVARAFAALPPTLAEGGRLCVDFYEKSWKSMLLPKYWLRPITTRMSQQRLFAMLQSSVPGMLAMSRKLDRIPVFGRELRRLVPVANYHGVLPLTDRQHIEWALLDTFDWFAPAYDNPQTAATLRLWLQQAGLTRVEVLKAGHLVGRGMRVRAPGN